MNNEIHVRCEACYALDKTLSCQAGFWLCESCIDCWPTELCALCGEPVLYFGSTNQLRGICADCDAELNGGAYSAKIVQQERRGGK